MRLLLTLLAATVIAGCGLKDDLYLPPPKPAAQPAVEPATARPGDDEEDDEAPPDAGSPQR